MKKLLAIVGPTGTGKSKLALNLAKKFNGEIVSADSRQIYKGMNIGTGKETQNPKTKIQKFKGHWVVNNIPIHLYDVIAPDKTFSVSRYQKLSYEAINKIHEKNKLPILVGGTGLYIQAVVEGLKIPKVPPDKKLRKKLEAKSLNNLVSKLRRIDPQTAQKIDTQNARRIIRALEVYYQTGQPFSQLKDKFKVSLDTLKIGLNTAREELYKKADTRVDSWFKSGFIEEVKKTIDDGYKDSAGLTTLGYRQVSLYLDGKMTLLDAIRRTKFEHHSYIRRQLTWFRRDKFIHWFDIQDTNFEQKTKKIIDKWLSVAE